MVLALNLKFLALRTVIVTMPDNISYFQVYLGCNLLLML